MNDHLGAVPCHPVLVLAIVSGLTLMALPVRGDCTEALRKANEARETGCIEITKILQEASCLKRSASAAERTRARDLLAEVCDCRTALQEAKDEYEAGRIEKVEGILDQAGCLEPARAADRDARANEKQAKIYLAKVYIALAQPEKAAAVVEELVRLDPGYRPDEAEDPGEFVRLVEEKRSTAFTVRVGSVSKADEPLREAPATVVVITAEEIERRGYLDLEQVLHDLPGFDISRGNGDVYSNVYMRGYRSEHSDRTLFLVDGVEQNDLHSNTAYISRQYPLSNVAQIEVVYGPASTIYGANAFTGVISITTKAPGELIEEGKRVGVHAQVGGGSFGTSFIDATLAGHSPNGRVSWSVTGRAYRSDERDLSGFAAWDFDFPASLDEVDYQEVMRIEGPLLQALIDADGGYFFPDLEDRCLDSHLCEVIEEEGEVVAVVLSPEGEAQARQRDRRLFEMLAGEGRTIGFADETDDWAIDAKLHSANFTFGVQTWRRDEGASPWYPDTVRTGTGNNRIPNQTTIYARYDHPIGRDLKLNLFSQFKQHELDRASSVTRFLTFAGQAIDLVDFALFEDAIPSLQEIVFDQKSTQVRNELTLLYEPSDRFHLIGGVELRNSSTQVELKSSIEERFPSPTYSDSIQPYFAEQLSDTKIDLTDLGIFAQFSYKPRTDLKIVVGGRLDMNSLGNEEALVIFRDLPANLFDEARIRVSSFELSDSGTVFNPRLALVHTRGDFVFKAIYAEAFKEPSNFQKYSREPGVREFSNPDLGAERVRNLELHVNWQPRDEIAVELLAYQADYSNAVSSRQTLNPNLNVDFPSISGRFVNTGRLEIRGVQAMTTVEVRGFEIFGNYTYTEPVNTDPVDEVGNPVPGTDELRIGDIARHRLNLGVHRAFPKRWAVDLRANYVGDRKTGLGTTVESNPFTEIDSYFVVHATLSYKGFLPGATWQLIVNNLFDTEYFHPGVQRAGVGFAARLPQPERAVFLRLSYRR